MPCFTADWPLFGFFGLGKYNPIEVIAILAAFYFIQFLLERETPKQLLCGIVLGLLIGPWALLLALFVPSQHSVSRKPAASNRKPAELSS